MLSGQLIVPAARFAQSSGHGLSQSVADGSRVLGSVSPLCPCCPPVGWP